jgi:hypothetical protein
MLPSRLTSLTGSLIVGLACAALSSTASEYIRLLGFGHAVGLLAEKGLPGFGALTQRAVNIDDVMKSGKKL